MTTRRFWLIPAALLLVGANKTLFAADTLHVGAGQVYATIQSAVNAAAAGNVVLVHDGTYVENVVVNKSITVISADLLYNGHNEGAVVNASGTPNEHGFHIRADNVAIRGFSIFGASGYSALGYSAGILCDSSSGCLISNNRSGWDVDHRNDVQIHMLGGSENTIVDNTTYGGIHGIMVEDSRDNVISRNTATASSTYTYSAGIYLVGGFNYTTLQLTTVGNTIAENTVRHNAVGLEVESMCWRTWVAANQVDSNSSGIWVSGECHQGTLWGNVLRHNGGGIHVVGSSEFGILNNIVDDNTTGIWLGYVAPSDYGANLCDVVGNSITNCSNYGVRISPNSHNNRLSRNAFAGNGTNVRSEGTSWESATWLSYFYGGNRKNHLGNYYDTYTGTDLDGDGIGDTDIPFRDGDTVRGPRDFYPLMVSPHMLDIQAWYLAGDSGKTMFRGNEGKALAEVVIAASSSVVWISDAPANADVTFPNAPWSGKLRFTEAPPTNSFDITVGSSSGTGDFTPSGATTTVGGNLDIPFETSAASVSVNSGQYLALKVTNKKLSKYTVLAGGPFSYLSSTGMGDPVWPSTTTDVLTESRVIRDFALFESFPNPFNPSTEIRYEIAGVAGQESGTSSVKLVVYDLLGRAVAVLVNERKAPGLYSVRFDAGGLASGVYLYRLTAGRYVETRKMLLLR